MATPMPVLIVAGPTGSGKSALAMRLAAELPVEIVSVDSAQVYRGMDVGTAKPSRRERALVPHHLLDIRDPAEHYSAGEFVADARRLIGEIHARRRLPLLVGGTMLYLRSLLHGIAALPAASPELRAALADEAARIGWPALHARLASLDPPAAARINPNDAQRIQRALEVQQISQRPISELQQATTGCLSEFQWLGYALLPEDRAVHRALLRQRFAAMLAAGLADEVRGLHARGDLHAGLPAIRSVGYRQLWMWCEGSCDLPRATELAIVATGQLAKRQLTWLRREPLLQALPAADPGTFSQILNSLRSATQRLWPE